MNTSEKRNRSSSFTTIMGAVLKAIQHTKGTLANNWVNTIHPQADASSQDIEVPGRWEQATFCSISSDFARPDALRHMRPAHRSRLKG